VLPLLMKRRSQGKRARGIAGLRLVAIFEGCKGVLVLLTGFGLLSLIHKDIHHAAALLVQHIHLNPASHYPRIFLDLSEKINDASLWAMAAAAMAYALVRLTEAVGLWLQRQWAEWFGALTGGIYIPAEIYELLQGVTWPRVTVLVVNVWIVSYLLFTLARSNQK
jgi:uncharacterized membrane protein (DUF2068 family)